MTAKNVTLNLFSGLLITEIWTYNSFIYLEYITSIAKYLSACDIEKVFFYSIFICFNQIINSDALFILL